MFGSFDVILVDDVTFSNKYKDRKNMVILRVTEKEIGESWKNKKITLWSNKRRRKYLGGIWYIISSIRKYLRTYNNFGKLNRTSVLSEQHFNVADSGPPVSQILPVGPAAPPGNARVPRIGVGLIQFSSLSGI